VSITPARLWSWVNKAEELRRTLTCVHMVTDEAEEL